MTLSELVIRVTISFIVLFILTRIMGRKEISQMTFFNFVSAIAIGSITANLAVNANLSLRNGVLALVGWTIFTLLLAYIDIKSKKARKVTTGEPIIVIKEGKIMEDALRSTQLDIDALKALLRKNSVFSVSEVNYAIFETSGNLSVMKKEHKQPATKEDLNIPSALHVYPTSTEVISDGVVNTNNLARLQIDESWVHQQLQQAGVGSMSEVFYAEVQQDGTLYIDKKDDPMIH
ncbi:YetF domain-containing protein [Alteribacillus iranensis]|uniref:Uncharacterized membrane protein YcaP, DUF421 family n=1 Tax=Alteribacillus iranensis TaxID=930128 RepID=A0A1I2FHX0_9BACI|nr:DUF421 domain-containing protein [Alteribacillus iranensis]SFF04347.1 Uncharacterized membrane protein YcaP, DUF421 family [Alteribacillus iranensis]